MTVLLVPWYHGPIVGLFFGFALGLDLNSRILSNDLVMYGTSQFLGKNQCFLLSVSIGITCPLLMPIDFRHQKKRNKEDVYNSE